MTESGILQQAHFCARSAGNVGIVECVDSVDIVDSVGSYVFSRPSSPVSPREGFHKGRSPFGRQGGILKGTVPA